MRRLSNVYHLGVKELFSLRHDVVMLALIVWAFSISIYTAATGLSHELNNASIGIVDEDRSSLSMRIAAALLPPQFRPPALIRLDEVDAAMDSGRYTFVIVIPRGLEEDLLAERAPVVQVDIDATAVMQAGIGATYLANIIGIEVDRFLEQPGIASLLPVRQTIRISFNPNIESSWFTSVMELITRITMLAIVITGAALIREREHGTIEHLLAMPLSPLEIVLAKVWANGLVILVATMLSLLFIVRGILHVPIAGSIPLFLTGVTIYLFSTAAIGVFLSTFARSMPQFGLLFILAVLPMQLLSGGQSPIESQPVWLQTAMQGVASTHFVKLAQAILYRGAGFDAVWPQFAAIALIGAAFFAIAVLRFRRTVAIVED
jgi:ABC-2 type transport system permease protein